MLKILNGYLFIFADRDHHSNATTSRLVIYEVYSSRDGSEPRLGLEVNKFKTRAQLSLIFKSSCELFLRHLLYKTVGLDNIRIVLG